MWLMLALAAAAEGPADKYEAAHEAYAGATCPLPYDGVQHYVYLAADRGRLAQHPQLSDPRVRGFQVMVSWRDLEPSQGRYDLAAIEAMVQLLDGHGKKLFLQLQDATFLPDQKAVPDYLLSSGFDGGVSAQRNDKTQAIEGWVAKRWNPMVQARFAALLTALGASFDGRLGGINLQETSISVAGDSSFGERAYVDGVKANMRAMKAAFPTTTTMVYANFMPGEWLPWEDEGYLREIYAFGASEGVGLGAPDLMPTRKGQLNHALALMHETALPVPVGIAIQDGNYVGKTGADEGYRNGDVPKELSNRVPMLHGFASDFLDVDFMFWVDQPPYFETQLLPCLPATPKADVLSPTVSVRALAPGVWMHTSTREIQGYGVVPSNGLVVADGGKIYLVDTAWTDAQTELILAWVRREMGRLPDLMVGTHAHADKMGGMGALRVAGVPSYALTLSNERAAANQVLPADHGMELAVGEVRSFGRMKVLYPGGGHTEDNLVVHVEGASIVFGGCLIRSASATDLGNTSAADVGHWAQAVAHVRDAFGYPRAVVPSHGEVGGAELYGHTVRLVEGHVGKQDVEK